MSVASGATLTVGGQAINSFNNGFSLGTNNDGYDTFQHNSTQMNGLMIWIGGTSTNFVTADRDPYELQTGGDTVLTSTNGFAIAEKNGYKGTLMISNWANNQVRNFTLELETITNATNYAIDGNLSLEGGGNNNTGKITANLGGKGISGHLMLKSGNNEVTFKANAGIGGMIKTTGETNTTTFEGEVTTQKIWIHSGSNTITFNGNATIRGSDGSGMIYSGKSYGAGGDDTGAQTLRFKGNLNNIESTSGATGVIISIAGGGSSNQNNTYNKLYFEQGTNTITGIITATTNLNDPNAWDRGYGLNYIRFESGTQTNTITGNIETVQLGQNEVIFWGSVQNTLTGNLTASGGNNTITFDGTGSHSITGQIQANGGQNIIDITSGTNTTIDVRNTEKGIEATITNNTISIASSGTNTIQGNITTKSMEYAGGGIPNATNSITFSNASATNSIIGDITATNYNSAVGRNDIDFGGSSNTISGIIKTGDMGGENDITFSKGSNQITGSITANAGNNTIEVTSDATSTTIESSISSGGNTLGNYGTNSITVSSSNINSITGSITSSSTSLQNGVVLSRINNITFSSGSNNSISGAISANGGTNTITFSGSATTNEITGKLDAQSGKNDVFFGTRPTTPPPNSDNSKWKCNLHNHWSECS